MKQADEPKLDDLKKLLKRLEKIDPESEQSPPSGAAGPAAGAARKPKQPILDKPANDADPADALLQLKSRGGHRISQEADDAPVDLPVIVKHPLPAAVKSGQEPGAFQTVIIASITAAVVSALATAGTVYWLSRDAGQVAIERPAISAGPAPQQSAAATVGVNSQPAAAFADKPATPPSTPGTEPPAAIGAEPKEPEPTAETADLQLPSTPPAGAAKEASPGAPAVRPEAEPGAADQFAGVAGVAAEDTGPQEAEIAPGEDALASPANPEMAEAASAGSEEPADTGSQATERPADITPPRPQLAGIPDVSGEIGPSEGGTQVAAAVIEPDAISSESVSGLQPAAGVTQAVSEISTARDLAAADPVGPAAQPILSTPPDARAPSAAAETEATVVAAFEAPVEAPPSEATAPPAASGAATEAPAAARTGLEPEPQVGPAEVALLHEKLVPIAANEPAPFPLQVIGEPEDLKDHHLIISGLKRGSTLSTGTELMFGAWRVEIAELPDLKLLVPEGFAHRLHILAELRRPDGTTRKKTELVFSIPGAAADLVPEDQEVQGLAQEVIRSVDAGEVEIDNGSLSAARILFERAAAAGSARAAMLLAATYDPNYSGAFQTVKLPVPDPAEARRWYTRASEMGASLAAERLSRLEAR